MRDIFDTNFILLILWRKVLSELVCIFNVNYLLVVFACCCTGRVVDGSNSERSQFTVQNQILSFNIKLLRHVPAVEPSTPFPLGSKC